MAPQKDTVQDDYYTQVKVTQSSDDSAKKPLKLKLKAVIKKPTEAEEVAPAGEEKAPVAIEKIPQNVEIPVERPKARLVEREHASEGLLRSVMHRSSTTDRDTPREEKKKPVISFGKPSGGFKPLENRPVMQIPPEERRHSRPPRRDGASSSTPSSSTSSTHPGTSRLRDDAKPMFQRDIGYATPSRDGTAKKSGKEKGKDHLDADGKRRGLKTVGVIDDGSFHRGHKVNSKKKEKSLEEVKQILVDRTGQEVLVSDVISVKEFSDKIGVPVAKVI